MFEYSYLNHYYDLKRYKMFFISHCPVVPKYEAYKIWAAWIIEQRSFYKQVDFFLPTNNLTDFENTQLSKVLLEKGTSPKTARSFVTTVLQEANLLTKAHFYLKLRYNPNIKISPRIVYYRNTVSITFQSIKHTLRQAQYYKLSTYYHDKSIVSRNREVSGFQESVNKSNQFNWDIWVMMNNYYLLDGHSYQWAIPNRILKIMSMYLKVKAEVFASPINSYYSEYFSLFPEDEKFGSLGNFFQADPDYFREGVFQVNPPFIDRIFSETVKKLLNYLEPASQANSGLMFILFMPNWLDCLAYQMAKKSSFFLQEMILNADDHHYYNYREHKYVKVQFDTHILVLSTEQARSWFSQNIASNIVNLFRNPFV